MSGAKYAQREGRRWVHNEVPIIDTTKEGMPPGHAYGPLWRTARGAMQYLIRNGALVPGYSAIILMETPRGIRYQIWYLDAEGTPNNPIPVNF